MLEKQDRRAITIKNKKDENIKTHYKRDTYITWFTQDGLRPHKNCQSFIVIPSNKMKVYNLHQIHCISSSLSHSLSHTITQIVLQCYNTIHIHITMLSFYRGITMVKYYESPNTMGPQIVGQQTSQTNSFRGVSLKPPFSGALVPNPHEGPRASSAPPTGTSIQ